MTEPLLAHRPASQTSSDSAEERGLEEEDALLTGRRTGKQSAEITAQHTRSKWREIGLFVWAVLATAAVIVLAVVYQHSRIDGTSDDGAPATKPGKRNLIFMVSDGMGPTSLSLTRSWKQYADHAPYGQTLFLDDLLVGQSRTRSTNSLVTDSAAGATAFSCGMKSYNGAISVLPNFEPCASVMEAAKRKGYTTGLVVTTRITDATPAVFASHARRRVMEDSIARQMIGDTHPLGRVVDLMMGGGRCKFLPMTMEGGCRKDQLDVIDVAKKAGWGYIDNKQDFDAQKTFSLPFMGLFAALDFPYEIDRQHQLDDYPSLEEMTKKALRTLSHATRDSEQGFFIMIEGSRIDHAGHANDPAAQVHEVLAYDRAMKAVVDFIKADEKETGTPTLMVSTSDHETGGLAVAKQLSYEYPEYLWYPGVLANVSHSASHASHAYHDRLRPGFTHPIALHNEEIKEYLTTLAKESFGISDCDDHEINALIDHPLNATYAFADMISRRAQTGWSTHGHSAADVNIYTSDPIAARDLVGNHENTDVGLFLRNYLGVGEEMDAIAKELKEHMKTFDTLQGEAWLGDVPDDGERLDGQDHIDHYHGDHKRCSVCGDH